MESKSCLLPVDAEEFFDTIRKDEVEVLEQLTPLEIFALDENEDLIIEDGKPVVIGYNPAGKISLTPTNRFYAEVDGKDNTLPDSIIYGYGDVFLLDESLIGRATLHVFNDPSYSGCVWIFEDEDYLGVYGIRSSIANSINGKRGVATAMMRCIIASTEKTIVVPWPLEGMYPVLKKLGFEEYNSIEENKVRRFLEPYTITGNYWLLER